MSNRTYESASGSLQTPCGLLSRWWHGQVIHRELSTVGCHASKLVVPTLVADEKLVKSVEGMKISLELPDAIVEGALVPLKYRLTDENTGEPVRDLEPYLGAWATR